VNKRIKCANEHWRGWECPCGKFWLNFFRELLEQKFKKYVKFYKLKNQSFKNFQKLSNFQNKIFS
jgi:3-deoxy-D-manno-octulosonic-acid transferase